MSALSTVVEIKVSLSKMLPVDDLPEDQVERAQDLLKQLEDCEITLEILSKSLIGTVVSKFKSHDALGAQAKALVKQWKKVATKDAPTKSGAAKAAAAKPKMERRDSNGSATEINLDDEWGTMQPQRSNICKKLHAVLVGAKKELVKSGINANAVDHLIVQRAGEVEAAIHKKDGSDKLQYTNKARSLCFNIKKNTKLGGEVIMGQISSEDLVSMSSEELASDERRKEMEERSKKHLDSSRLDWDQANESKINDMCGIKGDLLNASLFTCGRCKSHKTTSTQKQTRSADEPMTVFVLCMNCGKRWKC